LGRRTEINWTENRRSRLMRSFELRSICRSQEVTVLGRGELTRGMRKLFRRGRMGGKVNKRLRIHCAMALPRRCSGNVVQVASKNGGPTGTLVSRVTETLRETRKGEHA